MFLLNVCLNVTKLIAGNIISGKHADKIDIAFNCYQYILIESISSWQGDKASTFIKALEYTETNESEGCEKFDRRRTHKQNFSRGIINANVYDISHHCFELDICRYFTGIHCEVSRTLEVCVHNFMERGFWCRNPSTR